MKLEYLIEDKRKIESIRDLEEDTEGIRSSISRIRNTDAWLLRYELEEDREEARIAALAGVHQHTVREYNPVVLSNESADFYTQTLYPEFCAYERNLRKLLYMKGTLCSDREVTGRLKHLERKNLNQLFQLMFTDERFVKEVKRVGRMEGWRITKGEVMGDLFLCEEKTVWNELMGEDVQQAFQKKFLFLKSMRNKVMHAQDMDAEEFNKARAMLREVNQKLEREIRGISLRTEKKKKRPGGGNGSRAGEIRPLGDDSLSRAAGPEMNVTPEKPGWFSRFGAWRKDLKMRRKMRQEADDRRSSIGKSLSYRCAQVDYDQLQTDARKRREYEEWSKSLAGQAEVKKTDTGALPDEALDMGSSGMDMSLTVDGAVEPGRSFAEAEKALRENLKKDFGALHFDLREQRLEQYRSELAQTLRKLETDLEPEADLEPDYKELYCAAWEDIIDPVRDVQQERDNEVDIPDGPGEDMNAEFDDAFDDPASERTDPWGDDDLDWDKTGKEKPVSDDEEEPVWDEDDLTDSLSLGVAMGLALFPSLLTTAELYAARQMRRSESDEEPEEEEDESDLWWSDWD